MDEGTPEKKKDVSYLSTAEYVISKSTGRRYNEVVQEFVKHKLGRSEPQLSNTSIPPSQVLTSHSDNALPDEGSYVSWECPDTPRSQRPINTGGCDEQSEDIPSLHSSSKTKSRATSSNISSSVSGMDSFQTADPFSPTARNVVKLSDSSLRSPWNDSNPFNSSGGDDSKSSGNRKISDIYSPGSDATKAGADIITVFPKSLIFPSPDRSIHGPPLTTFSQVDANAEDSFSTIPIQTPTSNQGHYYSVGKGTPRSPHTPSIRLTSVKGSSQNLFEGSTSKEPTIQTETHSVIVPLIDEDVLLSPSLTTLTERIKSRHPLGKDNYDLESPEGHELSGSSMESKGSDLKSTTACVLANEKTPSDHNRNHSGEPKQSDDSRSFYSLATSLPPSGLDSDNISGNTESLKKYKTPIDGSELTYPPEETDVKTYTMNISTPPRSMASSRSSLHPKDISSWQVNDDMAIYQNEMARMKSLRRRLQCGWFLIVMGSLLLISCVIAILAIEIPAHRGEVLKVIANSQPLFNYLDEFKGFILTTTNADDAVESSTYTPPSDVIFIPGKKTSAPGSQGRGYINNKKSSTTGESIFYFGDIWQTNTSELPDVGSSDFSLTDSPQAEKYIAGENSETSTVGLASSENIAESTLLTLGTEAVILRPLHYSSEPGSDHRDFVTSVHEVDQTLNESSTHKPVSHLSLDERVTTRTSNDSTLDGSHIGDSAIIFLDTKTSVPHDIVETLNYTLVKSTASSYTIPFTTISEKLVPLTTISLDNYITPKYNYLTSDSKILYYGLLNETTSVGNIQTYLPSFNDSVAHTSISSAPFLTDNKTTGFPVVVPSSHNSSLKNVDLYNVSTKLANSIISDSSHFLNTAITLGPVANPVTSDPSASNWTSNNSRGTAKLNNSGNPLISVTNVYDFLNLSSSHPENPSSSFTSNHSISPASTSVIANGSTSDPSILEVEAAYKLPFTNDNLSPSAPRGIYNTNSSNLHVSAGAQLYTVLNNNSTLERNTSPTDSSFSTSSGNFINGSSLPDDDISTNNKTSAFTTGIPPAFVQTVLPAFIWSLVNKMKIEVDDSFPIAADRYTVNRENISILPTADVPSIASPPNRTVASSGDNIKISKELSSVALSSITNESGISDLDKTTTSARDMNPQNIFGVIKNMSARINPAQNTLYPTTRNHQNSQSDGYVDKDFLSARPEWLDNYHKFRKSSD